MASFGRDTFGREAFGKLSALGVSALGRVFESNLAQAITPLRAVSFGQASEADAAQAITIKRTVLIGQATETDASRVIVPAIALTPPSLEVEVEFGQALVLVSRSVDYHGNAKFKLPQRRDVKPSRQLEVLRF